jgi:hypothetical protein
MTYYQGEPGRDPEIALCAASLTDALAAKKSPDYSDKIDEWARLAAVRDDIVYFGISFEGQIIGHIFLHDWDQVRHESLIGYDLYDQEIEAEESASALSTCCSVTWLTRPRSFVWSL